MRETGMGQQVAQFHGRLMMIINMTLNLKITMDHIPCHGLPLYLLLDLCVCCNQSDWSSFNAFTWYAELNLVVRLFVGGRE